MHVSTFLSYLAALSGGDDPATLGGSDTQDPAPTEQSVTWKDLFKSGSPVQFYGFLRLDAYYNSARMNNIILPFTVSPEDGTAVDDDDAGFALDPRLTRVGMDLRMGDVSGTDVNGKLEIDFANFPTGSAESRATPRIRLAYVDLFWEEFGLRLGQDWDIISPMFPAANGETLMWNAGNTGDRRAQIQGRWAPPGSRFSVKAALGLTGAVTNEDLDAGAPGATPERDGFDSGLPHLQLRGAVKFDGPVEKKPVELGAWGALGRTETDTSFGGQKRFDVNILGADFQVPISDRFSARGEAWTGQNLGDFRGGIGQSISSSGDEIGSVGGWAELGFAATDKLRYHVGSTLDDPDDDDLDNNRAERNFTGYVGTVRDWKCGLRTGFDVIYWATDWKGNEDGDGYRLNLYFQYNF
jgi:hypothetical protein